MEAEGITVSEFKEMMDERAKFYRDENISAMSIVMSSSNGAIIQKKQVAGEIITKEFELLPWGLQTLGTKLGIPAFYARRCPSILRATNFNYWIAEHAGSEYFIRFDGYPNKTEKIRAVLSKRYADFSNASLGKMLEDNIDDKYEFTVSFNDDGCRLIGDIVSTAPEYCDDDHAGAIHMVNSEVGLRKLSFETMVNFRALSSGIIIGELGGYKEKHLGDNKTMSAAFKSAMSEIMDNYRRAVKGLTGLKDIKIEDHSDMLDFIVDAYKLKISIKMALKRAEMTTKVESLYDIVTLIVKASIDPGVAHNDREVLQRVGGKITSNYRRYKRWQIAPTAKLPKMERTIT